jgi:hypothetical protein
MQHVPDPCAGPVLLVEQNVEYQLWLQRVAVEGDAARRGAYLAQLRSTWTDEISACQRSDLVAVLTEEDRIRRPDERDELARQVRALARTLPSWDDAAASLADCYRELAPVSSRRTVSVA